MSRLTIITINRNNAAGLAATLRSMTQQTFKDFELIVVDGASTDNSRDVITQHQAIITRSLSEPDRGIYDAQNKGIGLASSEYLLFLNSGDELFAADVLSNAVPLLSADICYGNMVQRNNGRQVRCTAPPKLSLDHMLNSTLWHPSTFIRKALFIEHGLYHTSFKLAGDYEFFVRCFLRPGISFFHLPVTVSLFDGHGISNDPAHAALLASERDQAWSMNLSGQVTGALKFYNWFARSRYLGIIMFLEKLRGKKKADDT